MPQHDHQASSLLQLPGNVLQQIVLLLPDPANLAGACYATSSLLDQDGLLLDWAHAALARCPAIGLTPTAAVEHRHPGYALLHWRRLHFMPSLRLAALLLRWVARCLPATPEASARCRRTQQLLDSGDALMALEALLPHSEHLLLLYAAQSGHTRLLGELLAAPGMVVDLQWLRWDARTHIEYSPVLAALFAAVRCGHVDAMRMLLARLASSGNSSSIQQLDGLHSGLLCTATEAGSRGRRCSRALLQLCTTGALLQLCTTAALRRFAASHYKCPSHLADKEVYGEICATLAAQDAAAAAHSLAFRSGLAHMLPQLSMAVAGGDVSAAKLVCEEASSYLRSASPLHLQLLAQAMLLILQQAPDAHCCHTALAAAFAANSTACLQAISAVFAAPGVAATHRSDLACATLRALSEAYVPSIRAETLQWALDNMLAGLEPTAREQHVPSTAQALLTHGYKELLPALQAPSVTAQLTAGEHAWLVADLKGDLLLAAQRADAAAVQAAISALQQANAEIDMFLLLRALRAAAALEGAAAAEAVARVLVPHMAAVEGQLHGGYWEQLEFDEVCTAHGAALLRVVVEGWPNAHECMQGYASDVLILRVACVAGSLAAAEWLPPCDGHWLIDILSTPAWVAQYTPLLQSFAGLLQRLAAERRCAGTGHDGRGKEGDVLSGCRPSAEAALLLEVLMQSMLGSGVPDLMHALLAWQDAWRPSSAP